MTAPLPDDALDRIFRKARSYNGYTDEPVAEADLHAIWDLMKWGPTSANMLPARITWCVSPDSKERLAALASGTNGEKIRKAPVTAIIGMDLEFYEQLPRLFPHADARSWFVGHQKVIEDAAFRNSSLQGAYFIIAARALGFGTGPMSGFDNAAVDEAFFAGTAIRSNFISTLGHGDESTIFERSPRPPFEDFNSTLDGVLLVLDTATDACSAALLEGDGRLVDARHEIVGRGHAERLVAMVAELLAAGPGRGVTRIAVDCGPGSFTGLRVGIAAARAFAMAWDAPLAGYSSLALIAAAADVPAFAVAVVAGHGELFVQRFAASPLIAVTPLATLSPAAAAAAIDDTRVIGSGAAMLVAARGHGEALPAWPRASDLARLPQRFLGLAPRPIYGRAPDARPQ